MKKIKLIILCLSFLLLHTNLTAQSSKPSGLFPSRQHEVRGEEPPDPNQPGGEPAPIEGGLLVLTGLAAGYVYFKRSRNED